MRSRFVVCVGAVLVLAAGGCGSSKGSDASKDVSAASLTQRLLPASEVQGFDVQRTFDWRVPFDVVGEGLSLPEATRPSAAVKVFEDNDWLRGAGEVLTQGAPPDITEVRLGVVKFKSPTGAGRTRDWLRSQDLKQPCYSQCIFQPRSVTLADIPGSSYVIQDTTLPKKPGEPGGPPVNYSAEFTVGPYLYWISLRADASAEKQFRAGIEGFYAHAKQLGTS